MIWEENREREAAYGWWECFLSSPTMGFGRALLSQGKAFTLLLFLSHGANRIWIILDLSA